MNAPVCARLDDLLERRDDDRLSPSEERLLARTSSPATPARPRRSVAIPFSSSREMRRDAHPTS
ncbi:MAG: hypothetical protein IPL90_01020 [Holophagales bacterium]|nr:hypothetical protein [Holophagales bacterium]